MRYTTMRVDKVCENCYFFRVHYAKDDNGKFHELKDAHCINNSVPRMRFVRSRNNSCPCSEWTPAKKSDPAEDIDEIIKKAASQIEKIAAHFDIE